MTDRESRLREVQLALEWLWSRIDANEYTRSPKVLASLEKWRLRMAKLEQEEARLLAAGRATR
jgi:hypothetical protein